VPRAESNRGGGDAVGDGDHGDDNAHDKTVCKAQGWRPTGTRDCWPPALPL